MTEHGFSVDVPDGYDEAVIRTRLAMRGEGFSILSEMHVGGLIEEAAAEGRQYLILGVYNGILGQKEMGPGIRAAVHLPCNVVVQETGESAVVAALDPADTVAEDHGQVSDEMLAAARAAVGRMLGRVAAGVS